MTTAIVPFTAGLLPAVVRFAERTWGWQYGPAIYRWRFLESPAETLVVMRGDECLAMLSAFKRSYLVGGCTAACVETFDWYTLPEVRHSGLGILLLREIMARPEPMLVVGGSAETMTILPRMGWRALDAAALYTLPLSGGALSQSVPRGFRTLAAAVFDLSPRFWLRSSQPERPQGAAAEKPAAIDERVLTLYRQGTPYGLVPIPDLSRLHWLAGGQPDTTKFVALYFTIDGVLSGWSLTKVYETRSGNDASLLECYAPNPSVDVYAWMVAETVRCVMALQPQKVRARATCSILQAALKRNRFVSRGTVPVRFWSREPRTPPPPSHLTYNVGDADMLPYPDVATHD